MPVRGPNGGSRSGGGTSRVGMGDMGGMLNINFSSGRAMRRVRRNSDVGRETEMSLLGMSGQKRGQSFGGGLGATPVVIQKS